MATTKVEDEGQRDHDESSRFVERLREILAKYPTP
jgi:hypothetical protein